MNFVNERISKRIEEIALELTEVFSVSDTYGEVEVSEKVYEILKKNSIFYGKSK